MIRESCSLHCAGLFRAIASALDCLAAAIVGVEAVPTPILRADFRALQRWLERLPVDTSNRRLLRVREWLAAMDAAAGPEGWLDWAIDMRNMLVHRGRRQIYGTFMPRPTGVLAADHTEYLHTEFEEFLPRTPHHSEIQAMTATGISGLVLPGEAIANSRGVLRSATDLIEGCAEKLLETWLARRADSTLARQPEAQWPRVEGQQRRQFGGYSSEVFRADEIQVAREFHRRVKAAGVADEERSHLWGDVSS